MNSVAVLVDAGRGATPSETTPAGLADAGVENVNTQVDDLIASGALRRPGVTRGDDQRFMFPQGRVAIAAAFAPRLVLPARAQTNLTCESNGTAAGTGGTGNSSRSAGR